MTSIVRITVDWIDAFWKFPQEIVSKTLEFIGSGTLLTTTGLHNSMVIEYYYMIQMMIL